MLSAQVALLHRDILEKKIISYLFESHHLSELCTVISSSVLLVIGKNGP